MQSPNFSQTSSSSLTPRESISNYIYCFNCCGYFQTETFLTHIKECLNTENAEKPPQSFNILLSKLSLGEDCNEILTEYNKEVMKKISMGRQSCISTDTEDNYSLSLNENDNNILEQLIKIQEESKVKNYLDFTSNIKRVTKVKNVLRSLANNEMSNKKCYF